MLTSNTFLTLCRHTSPFTTVSWDDTVGPFLLRIHEAKAVYFTHPANLEELNWRREGEYRRRIENKQYSEKWSQAMIRCSFSEMRGRVKEKCSKKWVACQIQLKISCYFKSFLIALRNKTFKIVKMFLEYI